MKMKSTCWCSRFTQQPAQEYDEPDSTSHKDLHGAPSMYITNTPDISDTNGSMENLVSCDISGETKCDLARVAVLKISERRGAMRLICR